MWARGAASGSSLARFGVALVGPVTPEIILHLVSLTSIQPYVYMYCSKQWLVVRDPIRVNFRMDVGVGHGPGDGPDWGWPQARMSEAMAHVSWHHVTWGDGLRCIGVMGYGI